MEADIRGWRRADAIDDAQFELLEAKSFPVILVFGGMEGTGVIDSLTSAYTVLDARHVIASAFDKPTGEESERPRMWRYWRALPSKGEMGVYIGASTRIVDRATGEIFMGRVPAYSVVVPGNMPGKPLPDGSPGPSLYCAVIVKRVDAQTRSKTSINDLLRD